MPAAPRVRKPHLGVVFSLHGNGMAVVDFLGNWGMDPSPKSVETCGDARKVPEWPRLRMPHIRLGSGGGDLCQGWEMFLF